MKTLQICPPHLPHVAILFLEIQKSHFSTLLFIYCTLDYLRYLGRKTVAVVLQL